MTTDTDRINWISENLVEIEWTTVTGCRCCGCNCFRITGIDDETQEDVVLAEGETLREAIDKAVERSDG